jgi:putative transposase
VCYHQHLARRREIAQRRHLSDEALLVHIRAAYAENRGAYGWPRIWRQLRAQGIRVGKQRVQRLMQEHGIQARGKRRFRVMTTDSRHDLPIAPNRLDRNFTVAAPNTAWSRLRRFATNCKRDAPRSLGSLPRMDGPSSKLHGDRPRHSCTR